MKVILHDEIFASTSDLALIELLALGQGGRHAMVARAPRTALEAWLTGLECAAPRLVAALQAVLSDGFDAAAASSDQCATLQVQATPQSDWELGHLTVADAIRVLRAPLKLLVENGRADFHFLLCLARPTDRKWLQTVRDLGWLEVQSAGGLGEIKLVLEDLATLPANWKPVDQVRRLRTWAMFDRDKDPKTPGEPSQDSLASRTACEAIQRPWPLCFFQLGRRAIENYLPWSCLDDWFKTRKKAGDPSREPEIERVLGFWIGDPAEAFQYRMKGLSGGLAGLFETLIARYGDDAFDTEYNRGPQGQPTREAVLQSIRDRI